jgi:hypothetical protein
MSTSAILPISSVPAPAPVDYDNASATSAQQAVFNSILTQLQQSISVGDLPSTQTLLNAVQAISPSASTGSTPLATFLASVSTALSNGSTSQAQAALATYQSAVPASSDTTAPPPVPTANPNAVAAQIAASLVQNENQLLLVNALDNPGLDNPNTSATSGSSNNSANSLISILKAAYPTSTSSSNASTTPDPTTSETTPSNSPYDALVSSIQASLAAGNGTITPALAYLQAAGNFVNTSA